MNESDQENRILESWQVNAGAWIEAVASHQIESRRLVTDAAMIDAVTACEPTSVVDIGCGEGWLARELQTRGIEVTGVDAVDSLVKVAREKGGGDYRCLSYADLAAGALKGHFDAAVCNFSLLGDRSTADVFRALPALLAQGGVFIVQTLHPVGACGGLPYVDGWRDGSWAGFGPGFVEPAPWYFRTLESWEKLFIDHGFAIRERREPSHPDTGTPVSLIVVGERASSL